jgi:tetratricopeptide (TPR) repeat protein
MWPLLFPLLFVQPQEKVGAPALNRAQAGVAFDSALVLYAAGDFAAAANAFLEVTNAAPRSADAWANLGAAAWETGDTAAAVVSWQRAMRLNPTASDVRANLARFVQPGIWSSAWIPPVEPLAVFVVAVCSWLAAWFFGFRNVAAQRPLFGSLELGLLAFALASGSLALLAYLRITDRDVAVVTSSVMSRSLPSLESRTTARLNPGEVVVMKKREREWVHVGVSGEGIGWVHSSDLLRIAID